MAILSLLILLVTISCASREEPLGSPGAPLPPILPQLGNSAWGTPVCQETFRGAWP